MEILLDGHVHIYDCFDLDGFFDAALRNFRAVSGQHDQQAIFFLLLAEASGCNWFSRFCAAEDDKPVNLRRWQVVATSEESVLQLKRGEEGEGIINLVAGRQIVTLEKLEVLSLFSTAVISDGKPLVDTIQIISEKGGLAVIPWGAGKWFGTRGKVLRQLLIGEDRGFLLGDNGGRPTWWPTPKLLQFARKDGIGILSGSDPLPLPSEAQRVGSFGSVIHCDLTDESPVIYLKNTLRKELPNISPFGKFLATFNFLKNQLQLRLDKKQP